MQTIPLGPTGISTTRLGFGCTSIMGSLNRRQSLSLLESAYDAGIRHFDTAPMYGYGEVETCLGEFLVRHRSDVTIATKFGIPPPRKQALIPVARAIVGPVFRRFPGLKQLARGAAKSKIPPQQPSEVQRLPNRIFTADQARASLESSLTKLRTDHIDLWLLHEVDSADLSADSADDPLLRLLEDVVRDGKSGPSVPGRNGDASLSLCRSILVTAR